jgi:hypothetical protein
MNSHRSQLISHGNNIAEIDRWRIGQRQNKIFEQRAKAAKFVRTLTKWNEVQVNELPFLSPSSCWLPNFLWANEHKDWNTSLQREETDAEGSFAFAFPLFEKKIRPTAFAASVSKWRAGKQTHLIKNPQKVLLVSHSAVLFSATKISSNRFLV